MSKPRALSPADFKDFDAYVSAVRRDAERRVIAAKNRLRERKGLPPLDPDTGREMARAAAPEVTVLSDALPATPPAAWRVPRMSARAYCALVAARDGLSLDQIGRAVYEGRPFRIAVLHVHISNLRAALRKAGLELPYVRGGRLARPYWIEAKS